MLPRKSKVILKKLLKMYKLNSYNEAIQYKNIKENIKLSNNEITNSLFVLNDEELIKAHCADDGIVMIQIYPKATYYFEISRKKLLNNIFHSFITPIIVSTIVSIITVFIIK